MSSSLGNRSAAGRAGAHDERQRKKPRLLKQGNLAAWLKSPSPSSSLVQFDPRCLLVIGGDSLTHVLRYLAPRDVCNSEMSCKLLRQAAAPVIDGMIREMNATCDSVSVGHGSRTKLSRYLAAKEMTDRVRSHLTTHTSNALRNQTYSPDGYQIRCNPSSCVGCESLPQIIDKSVFDTDGKEYEFYLCFFDVREPRAAYFQGFVPAQKGEDIPFSFYVQLWDVISKSKWEGMKEIFTDNSEDLQRSDGRRWREKWETAGGFDVAVAVVVVHKQRCEASFLGAAMEFIDFDLLLLWGDTIGVSPMRHVKCGVHDYTYMDDHDLSCVDRSSPLHRFRTAATDFWLEYRNADKRQNSHDVGGKKTFLLIVRFHGDKRNDGVGWVGGKHVDD